MTPELFRALLKAWRATLPKRSCARIKSPKGAIKFPKSVERKYAKFLAKLFRYYVTPFMVRIKPIIAKELKIDSLHIDSDQLDNLLGDMENWDNHVYYDYTDSENYGGAYKGVESNVAAMGWDANEANVKIWKQMMSMALPEAFPLDEPWVTEAIDDWAKLNATLIDQSAGAFYAKAEAIVRTAVMEGRRAEDVMQDLLDTESSLTKSRAAFIARDQIGNLTAMLTKKRNESAGISMYTWATAMDERVRGRPFGRWEYSKETHWIMEGKVCKWDDPTVYSTDGGKTWESRTLLMATVTKRESTKPGKMGHPGKAGKGGKSMTAHAPLKHPGQSPNCRCGSRPMMDGLISELDAELSANDE